MPIPAQIDHAKSDTVNMKILVGITSLFRLKKLNQMRSDLGWNASPKLERILIERVCQTWLCLHWLELAEAQSKNRPIDLAKHESDRIERAERRHLRAVKMLATVRKMAAAADRRESGIDGCGIEISRKWPARAIRSGELKQLVDCHH